MIDFDIEWQIAPGVRDSVLARTWCALTIRVDDQVVTRVFDKRTHGWRNAVYGSAFPLCAWIVDNLWFLLYEPYRWSAPFGSRDLARNTSDLPWVHRHSLLAAREGGALPDFTLCRDGDAVLARWLRDGGDASHPFLRFVQEGFSRLDPDAVSGSLARFVETVLLRVSDIRQPEVAQLREDWSDIQGLAPEEAKLCIWSARLGINAHYADELSDEDARRLEATMAGLDPRLAEDLLDAATIDTIGQDVQWIDEAHRMAQRARRAVRPKLDRSQDLAARPRNGGRAAAYTVGYSQTQALRQRAGTGDDTLVDLPAFVQRLGWADPPVVSTESTPASALHAVVDFAGDDRPLIASHAMGSSSADRFLLARSLFLQTSSPPRERRLVTSSHTWTQRASRAFAAELLAPADALRHRIRDDEVSAREVAQFADEFLVDHELIERQIENHALAHINRGRRDLRQW